MKVLVLGYYYRHNLGDEMFSYVFRKYFEKYWPDIELVIKNTDDLKEIPSDVSIVICGGGDLINDYFLTKIHRLINSKKDYLPIYALGIGVPYPNMIEQGALDCFDYIIHRNKIDEERLLTKYGPNRVQYFPDLGFMLPTFCGSEIVTNSYKRLEVDDGQKIGIFLSKTIFHPSNPQAYQQILDNIAYFLVKLARTKKEIKLEKFRSKCTMPKHKYKYQIYLIPSSTNQNSTRENDQLINQDLYQKMKTYGNFSNVHVIEDGMKMEEILPIFRNFKFTICTRFHAHVFSILAGVPILSIHTSRKVETLLHESGISEYGIKMPVDPDYLFPVKLDCWPLFEKYNKIINEYDQYTDQLENVMNHNRLEMKNFKTYFKNLLFTPIKYQGPETEAFLSLVRGYTRWIANRIILYYFPKLKQTDPGHFEQYLKGLIDERMDLTPEERFNVHDLVELAGVEKNDCAKEFISEMISFMLTGLRVSDYNYGLFEQVLTPEYHLFESVKWILRDDQKNQDNIPLLHNQVMTRYRKFNMHYFKQHDLDGYHRSGWTYVVNNLEYFHNNHGPIFDSFLDKTFCWNYDFYHKIGILPFKQNWVGVFHHTPNENYSDNNLTRVFQKDGFLESLKTCQGIYVLSSHLKFWLMEKLKEVGFAQILVDVLYHPTETPDHLFSFHNFMRNKDKRVIQIGAWMRNTYGIYQLPQPKYLKKTALKGRAMDNYYPREDFLPKIKDCLYKIGCSAVPEEYSEVNRHGYVCRPHGPLASCGECYCNKYIVGLYQMIEDNQNSVEIMDHLNNNAYDELLAENVVFVNLVDASAVNTVIECIVRNTPLVINRLPAVEEYLGKHYPLYYDNIVQAEEILNDMELLREGHEYLKRMSKKRFDMNFFLKGIISSRIFRQIVV